MIRISKSDDPNTSPSTERQIMITGNTDSVALAKSLINMSLDLHKASLERAGRSSDEEDPTRVNRWLASYRDLIDQWSGGQEGGTFLRPKFLAVQLTPNILTMEAVAPQILAE